MFRIFVALIALIVTIETKADDSLANELALARSWLEAQQAYDQVPGLSAAIVRDQELLWAGGFGYADLETRQPANEDTIYGICSISKVFTAVAAMQLRDQGKMQLDEPVSDLLSWFNIQQSFQDSPNITLRGLLTHSAGLPRESDTPYWMGPDFTFPSREEVKQMLGGQSTIYPADRYHQYSNLGLSLVGEIVAEQSGQSFDEYIEKKILGPLEMNDTATGFPVDDREPRIATGYGYSGRDGQWPVMPRYETRGITPAAGFTSTARDLARFASWQFSLLSGASDQVLNPNTLREMQRVQWMDMDWTIARGLGFGVYRAGSRTLTGHGGDCPGFNTRLFLDPVSQLGVITMANRNNTNVYGYGTVLYDILEAVGTNQAEEDESAFDPTEYLGSYDIRPWGGEELVFQWKNGLATVNLPTMSPVDNMTRLEHVEGDLFYTIRSDDTRGHEVRFRRDESGNVTHIEYHGIALPRM